MLKKIISFSVILTMFFMTACTSSKDSINNVAKPGSIATGDEVHPTQAPTSVEESDNVNGMRYNTSLQEFTRRYNIIMMDTGGTDYLYRANWKIQGEIQKDNNGVEYQLYYYDEDIFTITAAVEVESGKLMNAGCGTTMNTFVALQDGINNSDKILYACAITAAALCGFNESSLDVLQDIFYRTTFEGTDSLWYEGNVFCLNTSVDSSDSENSTMLFRIFPISEELKAEWEIVGYEEYIAALPSETVKQN